jgi:hypothetical protein
MLRIYHVPIVLFYLEESTAENSLTKSSDVGFHGDAAFIMLRDV